MPDILPTINNEPPQGIQALLDTVYLWNPDVANDLIEKINLLLSTLENISGKIRPYSEMEAPVPQYMPCYDGDSVYVAARDLVTLPAQLNPSDWILIATKASGLQAGTGISIDGNEISVTQAISDGAAAGSTAVQPNDLGTAAYAATTDFATAAQGSLADSAVQPGDLGTAAYAATTDFATAAQGQLADSAIQASDLGTAAYAASTDFATAAQGAKADTAIQSVKTINGNDIVGTGNVALTAFATYPAGWPTSGTTKAFCDAIAADSTAVEGMAYLGEVTLTDMPASISNSEIQVEIMSGTTAANKVILLTLTSGNVAPYRWQYTYWNAGSNVSGWINIGQQVNVDWDSSSGVTQILNKPAIPTVVDNYNSTSGTAALSANMGHDLNERLTSVEGRGRFLSTWNCATGLAGTNPPTSPYTYKSGDYFIVSVVGATNYKPSGSQYVTGTASTVVETGAVAVNDTYQYDGSNWVLLKNTVEDPLPSQAGNNGKYLTTDGTAASWAAISFPVSSVNTKTGAVTLTASDVGALPDNTHIPADPVQADWDEADSGALDYIKNKPTIPAAQVNSDWDAVSGVAQILNKPSLATVATSGSYTDLTNTPSIPAAQVNSDWNASSGVAEILNKPTLAAVATSGAYADLSGTPSIPTKASDVNAVPQLSTLPTAGVDYLGQVVQFVGTTGTYTNGYFYECVSDGQPTPTYSWTQKEVQPSSGGLPSQTGNAGKFLTTDGTDASWGSALANKATSLNSLSILGSSLPNDKWYVTVVGAYAGSVTQENGTYIGYHATGGVGSYEVAVGSNSIASDYYTTSIGGQAQATNTRAISIGYNAKSTANGSIQIGDGTNATARSLKVGWVLQNFSNVNYTLLESDGTIPTDRYTTTPSADGTYVPTLTISSGTATRSWAPPADPLPSQSGQSGKFLTTDGTDPSWATISALQNTATGSDSLTIIGTATLSSNAVNIGNLSSAAGDSVSIGSRSSASTSGTSVGARATAADSAISVGYGTKAQGSNAVAIGPGAEAKSMNSVAMGILAIVNTSCNYAIQLGCGTNSEAGTLYFGTYYNNANANYKLVDSNGTIPTDRFTTTPVADGTYVPTLTISSGVATRSWAAPGGGGSVPTLTWYTVSTAGNTLTIADTSSAQLVKIYKNGLLLQPAEDYTISGTTLTTVGALVIGDKITTEVF